MTTPRDFEAEIVAASDSMYDAKIQIDALNEKIEALYAEREMWVALRNDSRRVLSQLTLEHQQAQSRKAGGK